VLVRLDGPGRRQKLRRGNRRHAKFLVACTTFVWYHERVPAFDERVFDQNITIKPSLIDAAGRRRRMRSRFTFKLTYDEIQGPCRGIPEKLTKEHGTTIAVTITKRNDNFCEIKSKVKRNA
jgi:hypothetical protein